MARHGRRWQYRPFISQTSAVSSYLMSLGTASVSVAGQATGLGLGEAIDNFAVGITSQLVGLGVGEPVGSSSLTVSGQTVQGSSGVGLPDCLTGRTTRLRRPRGRRQQRGRGRRRLRQRAGSWGSRWR